MPFAFAGGYIESDEAVCEEVVARSICAVAVASGRFYRQIDKSKLSITRQRRPNAGIAADFCAVIHPCFVADIASLRNGTKCPEVLTRYSRIASDVAFHVFFRRRTHAHAVSWPNNDHIVHNERRHRRAYINIVSTLGKAEAIEHINTAIVTERRVRNTGFGIERD